MNNTIKHEPMRIAGKKVDAENKIDVLYPYTNEIIGTVPAGTAEHAKQALDIAAKFNSNVYSAQRGLIIFADKLDELGSTIIIAHPNNYYSLYSHLNKIFVSKRDYVKGNQAIGTIGESGNSDGPHLHFEIWENSNIIDPREIIKEYKLKDVSIKKNI